MLQNAYLVAKIGADTAENEQHLPKFCRSAVVSTSRAPASTSRAQRMLATDGGCVKETPEIRSGRASCICSQKETRFGPVSSRTQLPTWSLSQDFEKIKISKHKATF